MDKNGKINALRTYWNKEEKRRFYELWKKANTEEEFFRMVSKDEELFFSGCLTWIEGWKSSSAIIDELWTRWKTHKVCRYSADGGSIAIRSGSFTVRLKNFYGDGSFNIYLFGEGKSKERLPDFWNFTGEVDGADLEVLDHDFSGSPVLTLTGRYGVYAYDGQIAFVNWSK